MIVSAGYPFNTFVSYMVGTQASGSVIVMNIALDAKARAGKDVSVKLWY